MEAAGAPRLDVERLRLVRRSTRGAGQRGPWRRDKSRDSLPAYAGAVAEERSARLFWRGVRPNCALGTLAY
jgi:hypothetical protein